MLRKLDPEFTFAGFTFPRYIASLPKGSLVQRVARRRQSQTTGGYYHAPRPNATNGQGFYLGDFGGPARWLWADDVGEARIRHSGYYSDDEGIGELIRGIVVRLPHARYLAGWSMGEGMCSATDGQLFDDLTEAARVADDCARIAAERQRDFEREENERIAAEDAEALLAMED